MSKEDLFICSDRKDTSKKRSDALQCPLVERHGGVLCRVGSHPYLHRPSDQRGILQDFIVDVRHIHVDDTPPSGADTVLKNRRTGFYGK